VALEADCVERRPLGEQLLHQAEVAVLPGARRQDAKLVEEQLRFRVRLTREAQRVGDVGPSKQSREHVRGEAVSPRGIAERAQRLVHDVPGLHPPRIPAHHRPDVLGHQGAQGVGIGDAGEVVGVRRIDGLPVDQGVAPHAHAVGLGERHQLVGLREVVAVDLRVDGAPLHLHEGRHGVELARQHRRVPRVAPQVAHHHRRSEADADPVGELSQRGLLAPGLRPLLRALQAAAAWSRQPGDDDERHDQGGQPEGHPHQDSQKTPEPRHHSPRATRPSYTGG
jgi:hypothetical protein